MIEAVTTREIKAWIVDEIGKYDAMIVDLKTKKKYLVKRVDGILKLEEIPTNAGMAQR